MLELPVELHFQILSYADETEFLTLLQVCHHFRNFALEEFLGRLPIQLWTSTQLESFFALITRRNDLAAKVRTLWISPFFDVAPFRGYSQSATQAGTILALCKGLTNIACHSKVLAYFITNTGSGPDWEHHSLTNLTVLCTSHQPWTPNANHVNVERLCKQLTFMRVVGGSDIIKLAPFLTNVKHLSQGFALHPPNADVWLYRDNFMPVMNVTRRLLGDNGLFPAVERATFTNIVPTSPLTDGKPFHPPHFVDPEHLSYTHINSAKTKFYLAVFPCPKGVGERYVWTQTVKGHGLMNVP
ncbi:hypothetical protein BDN72DRAFT_892789 [Pluteus cervinus]|uniref:Uncharacterized protein n=1 Tax=Pluteus cervinus TaxID=181527 RepID=A0ACD3B9E1_9AGAR|nr:hypothetical protein BDN72DRAFT_892789 [Pluteus cervinus]